MAQHERSIDYATYITIPTQAIVDRGFKECCYKNIVLASLTESDAEKNDYTSFFFVKQNSSDTCDFVLINSATLAEYSLDDTYGELVEFGGYNTQPNLKTFKVEWRKVLNVLGAGTYQIRKDISISGITNEIISNTYTLRHYSTTEADRTIRIDSVFNGEFVNLGVDFKGTGYSTTLRTKGFFGNREVKYTVENLVRRGTYKKETYDFRNENEYILQTGAIPDCITDQIFDLMLWGDEIFITDYNSVNHSYKYKLFPVELAENIGTEYINRTRRAVVNIKFKDRYNNQRKINC